MSPRLASVATGLTAAVVLLGWVTLDPLPPTVGPIHLVPVLLLGIGLALEGAVGQEHGLLSGVLGGSRVAYTIVGLAGLALVAVGAVGLGKLAPAGAGGVLQGSRALEGHCRGEPSERVDRELLPLLERLQADLPGQSHSAREAGEAALREHLPRCVDQLAVALEDPDGTHTSWRLLRDWLVAHPDLVEVPAAVRSAPVRPRVHEPARRPVQLDLR
ncbi:MAG: hypothetical protein KC656_04150 [Myxococcales bacterium]|nr:hypothetical protein [Myxococcales bacterium]